MELNRIYNADCIGENGMCLIPDKSIDMILCDLPYGQTRNKWDVQISAYKLWKEYSRIIKDNGVIALTCNFLFANKLLNSATVPFRYDLIWKKNKSTGFLNANKMPLRQHELILIFYKKTPNYFPQKTTGHKPANKVYTRHTGSNYGELKLKYSGGQTDRHPTSVIEIPVMNNYGKINSTQKPVELYEWLIKSFTAESEVVLDNCSGSGTIGIACMNLNRNYIGFEKDSEQFNLSVERIENYRKCVTT